MVSPSFLQPSPLPLLFLVKHTLTSRLIYVHGRPWPKCHLNPLSLPLSSFFTCSHPRRRRKRGRRRGEGRGSKLERAAGFSSLSLSATRYHLFYDGGGGAGVNCAVRASGILHPACTSTSIGSIAAEQWKWRFRWEKAGRRERPRWRIAAIILSPPTPPIPFLSAITCSAS